MGRKCVCLALFAGGAEVILIPKNVTTLGHVQRGGAPTAYDRLLATRLGAGAVASLARGEQGTFAGMIASRVVSTPLSKVVGVQKRSIRSSSSW